MKIVERAIKGYCKEDIWDMSTWFIKVVPKMLGEFAEKTYSHPCEEDKLQEEVEGFPMSWVAETVPKVRRELRKYKEEFAFDDGFCNWLLIIYRMKYCIEHLDECHKDYEDYLEKKDYKEHYKEVEDYKKEAVYLLKKWFWDLWY